MSSLYPTVVQYSGPLLAMDAAFVIINHYRHKDHVQSKAFYTSCRLCTLYHHNKEHSSVMCSLFSLALNTMNDIKS